MTTHHTSGAADLPEALRYTNILDAWATDLPLAGKIAVELLRLHTLTEQQQRELIKESHRTAEQKLRADQMTEQHRHQAALNTEARAQLAALTAQAISAEPAGARAAELRRMHAELETLPVGYINRGIAPHTKGRTVFHEKPTINLEARWWSRDAPVFLASHGQAPASVLHLVHSAFAEIAMAFPKAFALHKVGIADTAVREALAAPVTARAAQKEGEKT